LPTVTNTNYNSSTGVTNTNYNSSTGKKYDVTLDDGMSSAAFLNELKTMKFGSTTLAANNATANTTTNAAFNKNATTNAAFNKKTG
jgi:hypothetical protein